MRRHGDPLSVEAVEQPTLHCQICDAEAFQDERTLKDRVEHRIVCSGCGHERIKKIVPRVATPTPRHTDTDPEC